MKEIGVEPAVDDERCVDAAGTEAPLMKPGLVEADFAEVDSAEGDLGEARPVVGHCYGDCLDPAPASALGPTGSESLRCDRVQAEQSEAQREGLI